MGEFLDRIENSCQLGDRDRTREAVRGVFYALMQGSDEAGCREVAALLPEELETLWKPALFTCLREHRSPEGAPADASFVERVRRRAPELEEEEVERLARAVLEALAPHLPEEGRDRLLRAKPGGLAGDTAGG